MSIKTFWIILIKILGMLLIFETLSVIPQWISSVYSAYRAGDNESFGLLIFFLLLLFLIVCLLVWGFIFKTSWIVEKLKLEKDFKGENIELNFDVNKMASIAIIVIGGLMFINNLPILFKQIFVFFQQKSLFKDYPESGWIIFVFCKVIFAYLLMTNSVRIANSIESKKSNN